MSVRALATVGIGGQPPPADDGGGTMKVVSVIFGCLGAYMLFNSYRIEQEKKKLFVPIEKTVGEAAPDSRVAEQSSTPAASVETEREPEPEPAVAAAAAATPALAVAADKQAPEADSAAAEASAAAPAAAGPGLNVISTRGGSAAKPDEPAEPAGPPPPGQRFGVDGRPIRITAKYVLVGSGTASYFALRGIREKDPDAKVVIIGEEDEIPYMRTPLSKELWFKEPSEKQGNMSDMTFTDWGGDERSVYYETPEYYCHADELAEKEGPAVGLLLGKKVVDLNIRLKRLRMADGRVVVYDKCLLATGGSPKNLEVFEDAPESIKEHVNLFRTAADFRRLESVVQGAKRVAVIGGGFLGSELAVAMAHRGKVSGLDVTQIYPEHGNMAKVVPEYLSEWSSDRVRDTGVTTVPNARVTGVSKTKMKPGNPTGKAPITLHLSTGKTVEVDEIVVAVGISPNTELAEKARLEIDPIQGGILVNSELEARSDVFVAGDVASFFDATLGRRREEHHDHAVVSGRLAGANMAGARNTYTHQSMFWSDLGPKIGYEAIGIVDSNLPTVGVWAAATEQDTPKAAVEEGNNIRAGEGSSDASSGSPSSSSGPDETPASLSEAQGYGKGVVFYMRDKRVVGMLLWNVFNKIPIARKIIRSDRQYANPSELARLFKLHESAAEGEADAEAE